MVESQVGGTIWMLRDFVYTDLLVLLSVSLTGILDSKMHKTKSPIPRWKEYRHK